MLLTMKNNGGAARKISDLVATLYGFPTHAIVYMQPKHVRQGDVAYWYRMGYSVEVVPYADKISTHMRARAKEFAAIHAHGVQRTVIFLIRDTPGDETPHFIDELRAEGVRTVTLFDTFSERQARRADHYILLKPVLAGGAADVLQSVESVPLPKPPDILQLLAEQHTRLEDDIAKILGVATDVDTRASNQTFDVFQKRLQSRHETLDPVVKAILLILRRAKHARTRDVRIEHLREECALYSVPSTIFERTLNILCTEGSLQRKPSGFYEYTRPPSNPIYDLVHRLWDEFASKRPTRIRRLILSALSAIAASDRYPDDKTLVGLEAYRQLRELSEHDRRATYTNWGLTKEAGESFERQIRAVTENWALQPKTTHSHRSSKTHSSAQPLPATSTGDDAPKRLQRAS